MSETVQLSRRAVRAREESLCAELLDLSYDAIIVRDLAGHVCTWNAGATTIYGWDAHEAIGQRTADLLHTRSDDSLSRIEQSLRDTGLWEGRVTQRRRDGSTVVVKARWARRLRGDGTPVICEINRDISEKVRAQAAEAAVGRQLALLAEHGAVAAAYIDREHRYRWVTQAYAARYDLPQSAFAGRLAQDVAGEEAYAVFRPYALRALAGESGLCEIDVPYATLPHQTVEVTYGPDYGPDGAVDGMVVAVTHGGARRAAEARARSLEQRLEFLVAACDIGTWYCDLLPDGRAVHDASGTLFGLETGRLIWTDTCRRHFGLAPGAPVDAQVVGARVFDEDRERVGEAIAAAIAGGGDYDATFRTWLPQNDGVRWIRGIGRVAFDEEGRPVRFDGITLDVTAQQRLESMLRERESWFRTLADDAPVALWQTDVAHECTYVSRQWCQYTGSTLASNLGKGWLSHVHPDDREAAGIAFVASAARREPFAIDYRLRRHDGVYRWVADLGMPRFSDTGRHEGFVGCAIDVHERKLAEQALLDDDRRKDEFLAMLAHELRNPLAPIRTAVHLLGREGITPETSRRVQPMLERQLQHLIRLVDDLLDVSRIRTGKLALRRALVSMQDVVALAVEASGTWDDSRATLHVEVPADAVLVDGDVTRLVQVVVNLLNNAAKFTPATGEVRLELRPGPHRVTVTVRDTGIGMDAEMVPRVFDLFVQAGSSQDHARSGLGIGLTLSRSLVEMHGGTVQAHSDGVGLGSAFTVTLPAA